MRYGPGSEVLPGIARNKRSGGQFAAPNTKLMGPVTWSCFHLYVILDIDRRRPPGPCIPQNSPPGCFVRASPDRSARVGWRIAHAQSAVQFKARFQGAMAKHAVPPDQLTLHADRGGPPLVICRQITAGQRMKAKATALLLADLGVVKSLGQTADLE